jgi:hypothetical protein
MARKRDGFLKDFKRSQITNSPDYFIRLSHGAVAKYHSKTRSFIKSNKK